MRLKIDDIEYDIKRLKEYGANEEDIVNAFESGFNFKQHFTDGFSNRQVAALCKLYTYNKKIESNEYPIKIHLFDRVIVPYEVMLEVLKQIRYGEYPPRNDAEFLKLMTPSTYKKYLSNILERKDIDVYEVFKQTNMHIFSEHTDKNDEELIGRIINKQKQGTTFISDIQDITEFVLNENLDKIARWICSKDKDYLHVDENFDEDIGKGYNLAFKEKFTKNAHAILEKDKYHPLGFKISTIFPDIEDKENSRYSGKRISSKELREKYNVDYATNPLWRVFTVIKPQLTKYNASAFYTPSFTTLHIEIYLDDKKINAKINEKGLVRLHETPKFTKINKSIKLDDLFIEAPKAANLINQILNITEKYIAQGNIEFSDKVNVVQNKSEIR